MFTFGTAVNQWFQAFRIFRVDEVHESRIHPAPRFDRIKAANNKIELHVVIVIFILDFAEVPDAVVEEMLQIKMYGLTR